MKNYENLGGFSRGIWSGGGGRIDEFFVVIVAFLGFPTPGPALHPHPPHFFLFLNGNVRFLSCFSFFSEFSGGG